MADYPSLVPPEIPDAQRNRGPDLFLQAMGTGLAAAARFAEMRRQSEAEMAKIALQERVSQEAHDLELKKIEAAAPLMDAHRQYYSAMTDLATSKAKAYAEGTATGAQRLIRKQELEKQLQKEVNDHARELKLDDPGFATKEPIQYGANFLQFKGAWQQSPLPWVQHAIREYQTTADQTKIPIRIGAILTEGAPPEDPKSWVGGRTVPKAAWQVARDLQNPETRDATMNDLRASGHIDTESYEAPGDPNTLPPGKKLFNWTERMFSAVTGMGPAPQFTPAPQIKTRDKPDSLTGKIIDESKSVPLELGSSRLPPAAPKSNAYETIAPTESAEPNLPAVSDEGGAPDLGGMGTGAASFDPAFEPTDTDKIIGHAKAAIAKGAPLAAVAQRLQENFGIDPSVLLAA